MMTLQQLSAEHETIPTTTSWYLAELGEARGKQELFIRQSPQERACPGVSRDMIRLVLRRLQKEGHAECLGRGPGASWRKKGNTPKKG